ncbi:MAG: chromosome segregation protein SMC [Wenzhouxiangellaceae bacterium]
MRLTAIKLAGFKSFVDPTTIRFPTNLTGVVGPNGCGKSNIIDAVRWVMGESSARQLRGESMTDVIFSGSNARKPVATASVELIFDNSDGKIAGEFANYNEISVRRQVSRDGQSLYFLNGTRCRRRDITDLFLGTGLGPRSYSIIEQGMISQVVEARPEELRHYLEEAAGISKYRERRRETENRIRHTRENLSRLADLREEVGKHLEKLQRQARAAERYKALQQERRELEGQLLALGWREAHQATAEAGQQLNELETRLQAVIAEQRHAESELETLREQREQHQEAFNAAQAQVYDIGGQIARAEQAIEHQRQLVEGQRKELQQIQNNRSELERHAGSDQGELQRLEQLLVELEPQQQQARQREATLGDELQQAENQLRELNQAVLEHQEQLGAKRREAEVARTQIAHLDRQLSDDLQRLNRLQEERAGLNRVQLEEELDKQQQELRQATSDEQQLADQLRIAQENLQHQRVAVEDVRARMQGLRQTLSTQQGKVASLETLQQAALGADDEARGEWLEQLQLDQAQRLAQMVDADEHWTTAVETALGDWVQAVMTPGRVADLGDDLAAAGEITLNLMEMGDGELEVNADSLAARVNGPLALRRYLSTIYCAASMDEALARQAQLQPHESVITAAGEWLGPGWARISRASDSHAGALRREQELRQLREAVSANEQRLGELEQQLEQHREALEQAEEEVDQARARHQEMHRRHSQLTVMVESGKRRLQDVNQREQRISDEIRAIEERMGESKVNVTGARGELSGYVEAMSALEDQRGALDQRRQQHQQQLEQLRRQAREASDARHALDINAESRRTALNSLRQSLERAQSQLLQLRERQQELEGLLKHADEPEARHRSDLEGLLSERVTAEEQLASYRARLQEADEQMRQQQQLRQRADSDSNGLREQLERGRLGMQELQIKARSLAEKMEALELGVSLEQQVENLPDDADSGDWQQQVERLSASIRRLEPVNLAAIQEYEQEQERKQYLDAQDADLQEALTTLENAIARIDRTTRTRFKETFDQVNRSMEQLFPRLFGGGHAYLELTGDDLLTTGVALMARPPGKRVASIHLLSGGEKALTAASFVFAIFNLNPAPFCMLDEVDAPLDEANVGRFSNMVKEMSEQVQFILVTHNKTSMEAAHQLCGVTMREPGVSRLVSVDIDEATAMVGNS